MPPRHISSLLHASTNLRSPTVRLLPQSQRLVAATIPIWSPWKWRISSLHTQDRSGDSDNGRDEKHKTPPKATPRFGLESRPAKKTPAELLADMSSLDELQMETHKLSMIMDQMIKEIRSSKRRYWWPLPMDRWAFWLNSRALENAAPFWLPTAKAVMEYFWRLRVMFNEEGFRDIINQESDLIETERALIERKRTWHIEARKIEYHIDSHLEQAKQEFFGKDDEEQGGTAGNKDIPRSPTRR